LLISTLFAPLPVSVVISWTPQSTTYYFLVIPTNLSTALY
jgi:hypothetical protein